MKILLIFFAVFFCTTVQISFADNLELDELGPLLSRAIRKLQKIDRKEAKHGGLNTATAKNLLKNFNPSLQSLIAAYIQTSNVLKTTINALQNAGSGSSSDSKNQNIPNKLLKRIEKTIEGTAKLFSDFAPDLVKLSNNIAKFLTSFNVNKNGDLTITRSFISNYRTIKRSLQSFHFEVSSQLQDWTRQVRKANKYIDQNQHLSKIPTELIKTIKDLMQNAKKGFAKLSTDVNSLAQKYQNINQFKLKLTPAATFVKDLTNTENMIATAFTDMGNFAKASSEKLGQIATALQTMK